jgi:hypothetical protein
MLDDQQLVRHEPLLALLDQRTLQLDGLAVIDAPEVAKVARARRASRDDERILGTRLPYVKGRE